MLVPNVIFHNIENKQIIKLCKIFVVIECLHFLCVGVIDSGTTDPNEGILTLNKFITRKVRLVCRPFVEKKLYVNRAKMKFK